MTLDYTKIYVSSKFWGPHPESRTPCNAQHAAYYHTTKFFQLSMSNGNGVLMVNLIPTEPGYKKLSILKYNTFRRIYFLIN